MASREKMRIILCEVNCQRQIAFNLSNEAIQQCFRQVCEINYGPHGMGAFGLPTRVVVNLTKYTGFFAIKVPSRYCSEAVACIGLIRSISGPPVTVRAIHISGRMKNTVKATIDRVINWRNSLPSDYAIPRKIELETNFWEIMNLLSALPSYA